MTNYSLTYTGTIVMVLSFVFKISGVDFDEGKFTEVINGLFMLIGAFQSLYGRWRLGGVNIAGVKK